MVVNRGHLRRLGPATAVCAALNAVPGPVQAAAALPPGFTSFFVGSECPEGWRPLAQSAGRLILGTGDPARVGLTAGRPLGDQEVRVHRHGYTATLSLPRPPKGLAATGGPNHAGAKRGTHHLPARGAPRVFVDSADIGLPLMQLPLCERLPHAPAPAPAPAPVVAPPAPAAAGPPEPTWPAWSVAFFSRPECPAPWRPYEKGHGRFIVPISNQIQIGRVVGDPLEGLQPPPHRHHLSKTLTLAEHHYWLAHGGNFNVGGRRAHGKHELKGDTEEVESDVPTLALRVCMLDQPQPRPPLPEGVSIFLGAKVCPEEAGWKEVPGSKGRYLVALPQGGDATVTFGGPTLTDGKLPTHTHGVHGAIHLADEGVAGMSGCWKLLGCAEGYVRSGNYPFDGSTQPQSIQMPYVPLRHCALR